MIHYHFCILHNPWGKDIYSDGVFRTDEPITAENYTEVAEKIAKGRGVDTSKPYSFLSLNRL